MNCRKLITLIASLFLFSCLTAKAAESRSRFVQLDGGIGLRSNYGIVGAGCRIFPSSQFDLHANFGLGFSGVAVGVGARAYFWYTDTPFLFVVPATNATSFGLTVLDTSGGEATIGEDVSKYYTTGGRYVNFHFEHVTWLWNHIALPIEVGYALAVQKPTFEFASGIPDDDFEQDFNTYAKSGFLLSIGLGLSF